MDINGIVSRPDAAFPVGARPISPMGVHGEFLVGEIHGPYYEQAKAGNFFWGATLTAGTTIPVNAASLVSTFTLWNPLGSGKNLVLYEYVLAIAGTTAVVIGYAGLFFQKAVGASAAVAPTSQTALTPVNGIIGGGNAPVATLLSAGTLTGTPTIWGPLVCFGATAALGGPQVARYDFKGGLIVPPGVLITIAGNVAQTQPMGQMFAWSEEPV